MSRLLLLDTHTLIWSLEDNLTLTSEARAEIVEPSNTVFASAASVWEITIKKALGKLEAPDNLEEAIISTGFKPLSITIAHALAVGGLPLHHSDPFDRLLVAQAKVEGLTLVTRDKSMEMYDVPIITA